MYLFACNWLVPTLAFLDYLFVNLFLCPPRVIFLLCWRYATLSNLLSILAVCRPWPCRRWQGQASIQKPKIAKVAGMTERSSCRKNRKSNGSWRPVRLFSEIRATAWLLIVSNGSCREREGRLLKGGWKNWNFVHIHQLLKCPCFFLFGLFNIYWTAF